MGRSYSYECERCGYRAKAVGRPDRGLDFFVQTILCRDCKEIYDAVTRVRIPAEPASHLRAKMLMPGRPDAAIFRPPKRPPRLESVLSRLPHNHANGFKWVSFQPQCPVSAAHRVRAWTDPDKCPRCGLYLDKSAVPFGIWD
jgi:hypothetical protein